MTKSRAIKKAVRDIFARMDVYKQVTVSEQWYYELRTFVDHWTSTDTSKLCSIKYVLYDLLEYIRNQHVVYLNEYDLLNNDVIDHS